MSHIRSLADRMNSVVGTDDLWASAMTFLPSLGLSKAVFLDLTKPRNPLILSNAGQDWDEEYTQSVTSGDDPFAANCLSQINPMLTGIDHLEAHAYLDTNAKDLIAHGSAVLGVRTGMSITISPQMIGNGIGWNLMSAHSLSEFAELREENEAEWRAWCQLTYAGLSIADHRRNPGRLTVREHDCLAYIADGLRMADIAHRLGIAETTVEMHLRSVRKRLGAKTRDQAVAMAIRQNLI
jgi:DNA-binding CsgD family transcriptional regulator